MRTMLETGGLALEDARSGFLPGIVSDCKTSKARIEVGANACLYPETIVQAKMSTLPKIPPKVEFSQGNLLSYSLARFADDCKASHFHRNSVDSSPAT